MVHQVPDSHCQLLPDNGRDLWRPHQELSVCRNLIFSLHQGVLQSSCICGAAHIQQPVQGVLQPRPQVPGRGESKSVADPSNLLVLL